MPAESQPRLNRPIERSCRKRRFGISSVMCGIDSWANRTILSKMTFLFQDRNVRHRSLILSKQKFLYQERNVRHRSLYIYGPIEIEGICCRVGLTRNQRSLYTVLKNSYRNRHFCIRICCRTIHGPVQTGRFCIRICCRTIHGPIEILKCFCIRICCRALYTVLSRYTFLYQDLLPRVVNLYATAQIAIHGPIEIDVSIAGSVAACG